MVDRRRVRIILRACVAAVALAAGAARAEPAITVLAPPNDARRDASLAFGADGLPVLSFVTGLVSGGFNLVVGRCGSADCTAAGSAANAIGANLSMSNGTLAIPADDRPMLAFLANGLARWTRCGNAACTSGNVTELLPGTTRPDMVLRDGSPIVVSTDSVGVQVHACQNPSCSVVFQFSRSAADADLGFAAIALGTDGFPVVALSRPEQGLSVGKCSTVSCAPSIDFNIVDQIGPRGTRPRIAVGSDGSVVFAYTDGEVGTTVERSVRVARCSDATCNGGATVNVVGFTTTDDVALVLRPGNLPLVAYRYQAPGATGLGLAVADCRTPTCAADAISTVVDPDPERGHRSAMAVDAAGRPVIAYEATDGLLAFARCDVNDRQKPDGLRAPGQSGEPLALVLSQDEEALMLVDSVSKRFVGLVRLDAEQSGGIAFTRDGQAAFIVVSEPSEVIELDLRQRSVDRRIPLPADLIPAGIALSPDGKRLYVGLGELKQLAIIDRASGSPLAFVPIGGTARAVALSADGLRAVVGIADPDGVTLVDTAGNTPPATLLLGGNEPVQVVIAPDGTRAYVSVANATGVAVIDLVARTSLEPIPLAGGAYGLALSQDGRRLYVGANDGTIAVVDPVARTFQPPIVGVSPQRILSLALTPDERSLAAIDDATATLALIDLATGTVATRTPAQDDDVFAFGAFVSPLRIRARDAVEFFHAGFGHYFTTILPNEIEALDTGSIAGWTRTGETFTVLDSGSGAAEVCRFFTVAFAPKSSHFYTPLANECDDVKANPDWIFEAIAYEITLPVDSGCSPPNLPLYRLYNDGQGGAPNHRYTTKPALRDQMIAGGFVLEGVTGCVPR